MVNNFIYNNPTWLWGTLVVAFFVGLSCLGLAVFHRLVHVELRRAHNDLAGFTVAIISVTYAVLLAFIAIATWESFTRAQDIVQIEADLRRQHLPRHPGIAGGNGQKYSART